MRVAWLLIAGLLLAQSCSSGSVSPSLKPPAHVVSDTVVVPFELTSEFNTLQSADHVYRRPLRDPASAGSRAIEERRAYIYWNFDPGPWGTRGIDEISIQTMPSDEGAFDKLIADLARRLDFTISSSYYDDWPGAPEVGIVNEDFLTTDYYLRSNRALSRGEIAWMADWMFLQAPDKIVYIWPGGGDDTVIIQTGSVQ